MTHVETSPKAARVEKDHWNTLLAGLLFIIAGALIYADNEGIIFDWFWWFVLAWGGLLWLKAVLVLATAHSGRSVLAPFIWGAILIGFSLHQIFWLEEWWPLALIVIGLGIIVNAYRRSGSKAA